MKKHLIQNFCKKKNKTKTKTKTKKQTTKLSRTYAQKNKENIFSDKDQQSKIRPIYIWFNLKKYDFKILSWLRSSEFKTRQRKIKRNTKLKRVKKQNKFTEKKGGKT